MGLVRMGPPIRLMLQLKELFEIKDFIETGTYHGDTAAWAASYFPNVTTIEYSREIYEKAVSKHGKIRDINFVFGDSKFVLKTIVPKLSRPAIFWLDSHWSGGETYGKEDECPLVEEIYEINKSTYTHFMFIDDARLFTSPPPRPHRIEQWPSLENIFEVLKSESLRYYIVIIEDVIVAVPEYAKEPVANYCQEINTRAWEEYGKCLNESEIKQGCRLINHGLRLVGRSLCVQLRRLASNLSAGVTYI